MRSNTPPRAHGPAAGDPGVLSVLSDGSHLSWCFVETIIGGIASVLLLVAGLAWLRRSPLPPSPDSNGEEGAGPGGPKARAAPPSPGVRQEETKGLGDGFQGGVDYKDIPDDDLKRPLLNTVGSLQRSAPPDDGGGGGDEPNDEPDRPAPATNSRLLPYGMIVSGLLPLAYLMLSAGGHLPARPVTPSTYFAQCTTALCWLVWQACISRDGVFRRRSVTAFLAVWLVVAVYLLRYELVFSNRHTVGFWFVGFRAFFIKLWLSAHLYPGLTNRCFGPRWPAAGADVSLEDVPPADVRPDEAGWISTVMLWFMNPLFRVGQQRQIQEVDLPSLTEHESVDASVAHFKRNRAAIGREAAAAGRQLTTFSQYAWSLWRTVRKYTLISSAMCTLATLIQNLQSLVLLLLIQFMEGRPGLLGIPGEGYVLGAVLFVSFLLTEMLWIHAWRLKLREGMRARVVTMNMIYEKTVQLSMAAKARLTAGKIENTMSTDCNRIEWVLYWLDAIFLALIDLTFTLGLLYYLLGWPALCGAAMLLVLFPLQTALGRKSASLTREQMVHTDRRMDISREMLMHMRVVKYYAWESHFGAAVLAARNQEMQKVKSKRYVDALSNFLGTTLPTIMALTAFTVLTVFTDTKLSPGMAVTSLLLFNGLKGPFFQVPQAIKSMASAWIAVERVCQVMDAEEVALLEERRPEDVADSKSSGAGTAAMRTGEIRICGANFYFCGNASLEALGDDDAEQQSAGCCGCCGNGGSDEKDDESNKDKKSSKDDETPLRVPTQKEAAMSDVNLSIASGEFVICLGAFGSGKSFLLSSILGETYHDFGSPEETKSNARVAEPAFFRSDTHVAYVPQNAWILNNTVRSNILFGAEFDEKLYEDTIVACALTTDFEDLPAGDLTEVGERGVTLSGGQKQRISIARAVYRRRETSIYLFDDPLSALDAHVTQWIFDRVFRGLLRGKTCLLVTHQLQYAPFADSLVVLESNTETNKKPGKSDEGSEESKEGRAAGESNNKTGAVRMMIVQRGDFKTLSAKPGRLRRMLRAEEVINNTMSSEDSSDGGRSGKLQPPALLRRNTSNSSGASSDVVGGLGVPAAPLKRQTSTEHRKRWRRLSVSCADDADEGKGNLVDEEERAVGAVSRHVYWEYLRHGGVLGWGFQVFLAGMILVLYRMSDLWMSAWSESDHGSTHQKGYYLKGYIVINCATMLVTISSTLMNAALSVHTSHKIHQGMLSSLLTAPMSFFDTTPIGRISNRLARDIDQVDVRVAFTFYYVVRTCGQVLSMVGVIVVVIYYFSLMLVPVAFLFYAIMQYFRSTSREIKRLDSTSKSPIFSHFSASLNGLASLRGYRATVRFNRELRERITRNVRAWMTVQNANMWLSMQLSVVGAAVQYTIVILCLSLRVSPAVAGVCISYGSAFCLWLTGAIKQITNFEMLMNSVERTRKYSTLPVEGQPGAAAAEAGGAAKKPAKAALRAVTVNPGPGWPREGRVEFKNVNMRYRPELPLTLRNVTVLIKPREKVGICGRTGSGKSTLLTVLCRLCEVESDGGGVYIDGVDVATLELDSLRRAVGVIPQEPTIFATSVRENLDPFGRSNDDHILSVLRMVRLGGWVDKIGGLDHEFLSGGEGLSVGQKQLFCMARALLHRPKILVLDEATASVDYETDALLQHMVKNEFKDITVLTIAHRIDTIIGYDKILVLDGGRVAEFGTPKKLIQRGGIFQSLVEESKKAGEGTR